MGIKFISRVYFQFTDWEGTPGFVAKHMYENAAVTLSLFFSNIDMSSSVCSQCSSSLSCIDTLDGKDIQKYKSCMCKDAQTITLSNTCADAGNFAIGACRTQHIPDTLNKVKSFASPATFQLLCNASSLPFAVQSQLPLYSLSASGPTDSGATSGTGTTTNEAGTSTGVGNGTNNSTTTNTLPVGAIIAIVLSILVVVGACIGLCCFLCIRERKRKERFNATLVANIKNQLPTPQPAVQPAFNVEITTFESVPVGNHSNSAVIQQPPAYEESSALPPDNAYANVSAAGSSTSSIPVNSLTSSDAKIPYN